MTDVKHIALLHDLAMAAAEKGDKLRRASLRAYRRAFDREVQAAQLATDGPEPSRSVPPESAVAIAKQCGNYKKAKEWLKRLKATI